MLSFDFTPSKDDYLKAFRAFYSSKPKAPAIVIILLSPLAVYAVYNNPPDSKSYAGVLIPIVILAFLAIYLAGELIVNPRAMANQVEKDERLNCPVHYEVTDDQILIKDKFVETKMDWGSFQKVIETREHFLLIYAVNKNMFQIIPRRAFATVEDDQAFKNLLEQKIPKSRKNRFGR